MELQISELTIADSLYNTLASALAAKYKPLMFYFDADHSNREIDATVVCLFEEYFDYYAVGRETSKSGIKHYQAFICYKTLAKYNAFIAKIKNLYGLKGRAEKGGRRQYGKVKDKLNNPDNGLIYCLKQKNWFCKGFKHQYLAELEKLSYNDPTSPKDKMKELKAELLEIIQHDRTKGQREIAVELVKLYYKKYDSLPVKSTILKILYDLEVLTAELYIEQTIGYMLIN